MNFDSNKLCEIIVCNRYLKLYEKEAKEAMEELSNRRLQGDDFDFESKIEELQKDLPDFSFSMKDFNDLLKKAKNI